MKTDTRLIRDLTTATEGLLRRSVCQAHPMRRAGWAEGEESCACATCGAARYAADAIARGACGGRGV